MTHSANGRPTDSQSVNESPILSCVTMVVLYSREYMDHTFDSGFLGLSRTCRRCGRTRTEHNVSEYHPRTSLEDDSTDLINPMNPLSPLNPISTLYDQPAEPSHHVVEHDHGHPDYGNYGHHTSPASEGHSHSHDTGSTDSGSPSTDSSSSSDSGSSSSD